MINLIYANGCSHTAGAEIEGDFAGDCTRKSFPAKIANYYNCNVINDALSGGSCDRDKDAMLLQAESIQRYLNFTVDRHSFWRYNIHMLNKTGAEIG